LEYGSQKDQNKTFLSYITLSYREDIIFSLESLYLEKPFL
jgi:hypothetical protein